MIKKTNKMNIFDESDEEMPVVNSKKNVFASMSNLSKKQPSKVHLNDSEISSGAENNNK